MAPTSGPPRPLCTRAGWWPCALALQTPWEMAVRIQAANGLSKFASAKARWIPRPNRAVGNRESLLQETGGKGGCRRARCHQRPHPW